VIHILDTRQLGRPGIVAATALETNDGLILFDTGPESTFENVVVDLRKAGFAPEDVRHVFVSHIHFDHAGAAWRFAEPASLARTASAARTGAMVYVHPRGAPHLIDPAKLIESAMRIFGDDMQKLWGKIAPVPAERVKILQDNDVVRISPFEIRAIDTPGHASHHHVYHWDDNIFGGDIAGVRIGGGPPIPPFVPPELHIESWHESIEKIRQLNPANLYLPHFGKVKGSVSDHLNALDERVTRWSEWFKEKLLAFRDPQSAIRNLESELVPAFAKYEHDDLIAGSSSLVTDHSSLISDYETADPSYMAVSAALRYWRKYHPK
jgi:glyoxylase-like metal-dependent hydrolase (beta-lactamase superfamily II)